MHKTITLYHHILVPLDGSELAETALATALQLAEGTGAQVTLLRVVEPLPVTIQPASYHKLTEAAEREAAEYVEELKERLPKTAVITDIKLLRGDAAETILYYADLDDVDLIVMTSHGRSGISRWYHGSVTESVLRGATCATLVLRQQPVAIPEPVLAA
ncbi:MAG: universal stress protein [Anaerolineales bacterium]|nr:universal stress protein [Anaerolineales bacterium]